jgi:molybdopterin/thiamine biosynthesis adenylyltransferase
MRRSRRQIPFPQANEETKKFLEISKVELDKEE